MTNPLARRFHLIIGDIARERARQEELKLQGKFPFTCADDGITDCQRYTVLGEEFGEVGHELNERIGVLTASPDVEKLRAELIQVAAVAVAWIENIDSRP
jgi:hypothetical protein